jgi:hypothetical protein
MQQFDLLLLFLWEFTCHGPVRNSYDAIFFMNLIFQRDRVRQRDREREREAERGGGRQIIAMPSTGTA